MSRARPLAADTSMVAEGRQLEVWGRMTPAEKFAAFAQLMELADAAAAAGIRLQHPAADERELFLRRAARRLDAVTMRKVYGFDPVDFG